MQLQGMKLNQENITEQQRINVLHKLQILDSEREKEYDDLVELASMICNTPVGLISLIDEKRQWFKSSIGIDLCDTELKFSFCNQAINHEGDIFEISDTRMDERFKDNPYTFGEKPVIFYAGVPLRYQEKFVLGTLCVIDHEPRLLSEMQRKALTNIAYQVVKLFEMHNNNNGLRETQKLLREKNSQLKNFAGVVSHDMKMPLASMILTIDMLKTKYASVLDESGMDYLRNLKGSAFKLSDYVTNILAHYESDAITEENSLESFEINELLEYIVEMLDIKEDCEINFPRKNQEVTCNRIALEQIFLNLIGNAIKYNDKKNIVIDLKVDEDEVFYHFTVRDNGMGIPKEEQHKIFDLFSTAAEKDRRGHKGNGIGLSTVRKLIHNLGGSIDVQSEVGKYTSFHFQVEKP
jgi:signal transduction histidine kinase